MDSKEIAQSLFEAMLAGDQDTVATLLSPDIVWRAPAATPLHSGAVRGLDELREVMGKIDATLDDQLRFTPTSIIAEGNMAAVISHNTASREGAVLDLDMVFVLSIKDGKVVEVTEFPQSPDTWTSFWLSE